jgi:hypothetical protein
MRADLSTKVLLFVIAAALCMIALRPMLAPASAQAAGPRHFQYRVISQKVESFDELERQLNLLGQEGWSLVSIGIGPMIFMRLQGEN